MALQFFQKILLSSSLVALVGCSVPHYDGSTLEGKAALLDSANRALSQQNCAGAIQNVEGLYNSPYTDNEVRLIRASAWGCQAGAPSFFKFITDLTANPLAPTPGEGSYFWRTASKLFFTIDPKGSGGPDLIAMDGRIEAGRNAIDALLAAIKPGTFVPASNKINIDTDNPGSLSPTDRVDDANIYMVFMAIAQIGAIEGRYGGPDLATFQKGQRIGASPANPLGWEIPQAITTDGCSYVSSILNLLDSLAAISPKFTGKLKDALSNVTKLQAPLDLACEAGCQGIRPSPSAPQGSGCALPPGSCTPCPPVLRNRNSCKPLVTDKSACAAAGIIEFIDNDLTFGWKGP